FFVADEFRDGVDGVAHGGCGGIIIPTAPPRTPRPPRAPRKRREMILCKPFFVSRQFCFAFLGALGVLGVLGGAVSSAYGYDFIKDSVPNRWIAPLVPEDLPDLKYPSYFNDVDKARAQVQAGRFRRALVTLSKAKNADPIEAAIVRATAQSTIGRTDQALATLAADK